MNAVLGLCSSYTYKTLEPFIQSLRNSGFNGDIILFVSNLSDSTIRSLENNNVQLVCYYEIYPYFQEDSQLINHVPSSLNGKFLSPNSLRYIFYRAYLKQFGKKYQWILHSDTRDVVFQSDPFSYYQQSGLYCFLEDAGVCIQDDTYNSNWIKLGFGEKVFHELRKQPISCSGVTLGTVDAFINYLDQMVNYIVDLPNTGGLDQGIHNYLIHKGKVKEFYLIAEDEGAVTTLGYKKYKSILFDGKGMMLNKYGRIIPVLHQYDRHLKLLWKYNRTAFRSTIINLARQKLYPIKKLILRK